MRLISQEKCGEVRKQYEDYFDCLYAIAEDEAAPLGERLIARLMACGYPPEEITEIARRFDEGEFTREAH